MNKPGDIVWVVLPSPPQVRIAIALEDMDRIYNTCVVLVGCTKKEVYWMDLHDNYEGAQARMHHYVLREIEDQMV